MAAAPPRPFGAKAGGRHDEAGLVGAGKRRNLGMIESGGTSRFGGARSEMRREPPRRCRAGPGILRKLASSSHGRPASRQRRAGKVELLEQPGDRRKAAVPLDDHCQRLGGKASELAQQLENGRRHIVQMIIEKAARPVRSVDPPPAAEMHRRHLLEREVTQQC